MVSLMSLLLPILLSAVAVFLASFVMNVLINFHKKDYHTIPREDEFLAAVRQFNLASGDYHAPRADSMAAMKDPVYVEKRDKGPNVIMTLTAGPPPTMPSHLVKWFVYSVVVSLFAAYIASRTLPAGTEYMQVFRIVATTAFMGYSLALAQNSIWYMKNWGATSRSIFDGLVYGLLTGGVFGWMWPGV